MSGLSTSYPTGSSQTITLQALTATISTAFYGSATDTTLAQVPTTPGATSVTVSVLAGANILTLNLISPSLPDEVDVVLNGTTVLAVVTVSAGIGVAAIGITGV